MKHVEENLIEIKLLKKKEIKLLIKDCLQIIY